MAYEKKETKGVANLKFKIESVSISGLVILKFDKEVYQFEDLNSREINVKQSVVSKDDNRRLQAARSVTKSWIEVNLIAGFYSDTSQLGFESEAKFTDNDTIEL